MKPGTLIHGAVGPVIVVAAAAIITMVSIDNGKRQYRAEASVAGHSQPYSLDRDIAAVPVSSAPISGVDALDTFIPTEARFGGLPFDVPHAMPNSPIRIANAVDAYTSAIAAFIKTLTGEPEELSR